MGQVGNGKPFHWDKSQLLMIHCTRKVEGISMLFKTVQFLHKEFHMTFPRRETSRAIGQQFLQIHKN